MILSYSFLLYTSNLWNEKYTKLKLHFQIHHTTTKVFLCFTDGASSKVTGLAYQWLLCSSESESCKGYLWYKILLYSNNKKKKIVFIFSMNLQHTSENEIRIQFLFIFTFNKCLYLRCNTCSFIHINSKMITTFKLINKSSHHRVIIFWMCGESTWNLLF